MEYYNKNPGLKPIIQMNHSSFYITKLLFTPDKKVFISQNLTRIKFWDTKTRKLIKTIEGDFSMLHDISISPDGKILAGGCENIKFWDIETGKLIDSISGNFDWIQNLVFMLDGNHLAVVTLRMSDFDDDFVVYDDNEILDLVRLELWNINDKKIIWTKIILTVPSFLKCTKNGWLVYNEKNVINLLNLKNSDNIKSFKGHSKSIRDVAFSPDGKLCSSCGRDRTIHIWNLETTDLLFTINEISDNEIYSLIFNQNGDLLIIGTDGEIIIWHLKKKRIIKKLQSPFSKNKKFPTPSIQALATFNNILIAASKGIEVWDITNFKLIEVLEPYDTSITSVVFTNNDRNLAFKVNNKIIFWDLKKNKFAKEIILDNKIHSITSTSDGKISGITKESKKCSIYTLYPKKDLKVFEHSNILYSIAIDYNNDILIAGSLGRSQFLSFLQKNKNSINNWKIHDYWLMVGKYRFEERDFS